MKAPAIAALFVLLSAPAWAEAPETEAPKKEEPAGPDVEKLPFSPDSIRKVVEFNQPKIQACYEGVLADKEKVFEGKIFTSFTITEEGLVKNARVVKKGSTLHLPRLNDCVVAVLASMTFPKPKKAQPVEYPFNLKAIK